MKVKIIKESQANMWYNTHVGEYFEVDERKTTDRFYVVKDDIFRWVRNIYKSDCIIIKNDIELG